MLFHRFQTFFFKGHPRTILAKKNILFGLCLKAIGMITMFTLVPLSIKYLGTTAYGVWVTISGVIAWAGMFDFGFSHGLRNHLTKALANQNYTLGKYLISSTYVFLSFLALMIFFILFPLVTYLDWSSILNLPNDFDQKILQNTLFIIVLFFIAQFLLKPINAVLQAYQWPSVSQAFGTAGGVLSVLTVWVLLHVHLTPELIYYALTIAGIPVVISMLGSLYFYGVKFKNLRPSLTFAKLKYIKEIGGLGLAFFVIQLSLLVVYSSDNLIISYLFGPDEVTTYNVVYRYFSIVTIFFGVIMTPFWSAITDAYTKNEMEWVKKTIRSLLYILLGGGFISLLLFFVAPSVFSIWISKDFSAPTLLIGLMGVYTVAIGLLNIFSYFSNGIGKIRIQLIAYIIAALINIPLSYFFGKILGLGSAGVVLATIACLLFINLLLIIQYRKIVHHQAEGIWYK